MQVCKFLPLVLLSISLLFATATNSQNTYSKNWDSVQTQLNKGLTQSAKKSVDKIYQMAIAEKNSAQQMKAVIWVLYLVGMTDDNSPKANISYIQNLVNQSSYPTKNILQSIEAELYWKYLQNNRWTLYNRTNLTEEKNNDFETWPVAKFFANINNLYQASLTNEKGLQSIPIQTFDPIIEKGTGTRQFRPTLFDFLAFRALDYWKNDEQDIIKAAYHFTIKDSNVFMKADHFVTHQFSTSDTISSHYHALKLLQRIIAFHLKDANPAALIDADLIRLEFMHNNSTLPNKNQLYEQSLLKLEQTFPNNPAIAESMFKRASLYLESGNDYAPFENPTTQYDTKKAKLLCDQTIQLFPTSDGGLNGKKLLDEILKPSMELKTEKVNIPGVPFKALVTYKNIPKLYCRIIKINKNQIDNISKIEDEDSQWVKRIHLPFIKSWETGLPDPGDFQKHKVEIKIDALPAGTYYLLTSTSSDFSTANNIISNQLINISNLALVHNNAQDYYILNRDKGQPVADASVQIWSSEYNQHAQKYITKKANHYTTDGSGHFSMEKIYKDFEVTYQIMVPGDTLFIDQNDNFSATNIPTQIIEQPISYLFTDRSIYRPGQTIYFKGIVTLKDPVNKNIAVVPNQKTHIILRDANNQKINELYLTTNEYGSYNGSFILPQTLLNGNFLIHDSVNNTTQSIKVEEYKRPKFFVDIQKPSGEYSINDSISITGTATAYAGNTIDGASVKYKVVRNIQYPFWTENFNAGFRFAPYRNNQETEISQGNIFTDATGNFTIRFKAIPDETIDKSSKPEFNYEVSADITDLNGETQSGNTNVAVAYQMLELKLNIPEKLKVDSFKQISLTAANLNDIPVNTIATIQIHALKSPDRIFRLRLWDMPDQFILSKQEHSILFPNDVYANEDQVANYETAQLVYTKTDSTNHENAFQIPGGTLNPGWYKITATAQDQKGVEVKAISYTRLTNPEGLLDINDDPIDLSVNKDQFEPGDTVLYKIKTGFKKIWLIQTITHAENQSKPDVTELNSDNTKLISIPVKTSDKGGISVNYLFIHQNRIYTGDLTVNVPTKEPNMNIELNSFRDKILPGSKEKWSIVIKGKKSEKLAVELLTTMYDKSLDKINFHQWYGINPWQTNIQNIEWTKIGFEEQEAEVKEYLVDNDVPSIDKEYDKLIEPTYHAYVIGTKESFKLKSSPEINQIKFTPPKIVSDLDLSKLTAGANNKMTYTVSVNATSFGVTAPGTFTWMNGNGFAVEDDKSSGNSSIPPTPVQIRKNFNETAFFFPDLHSDTSGNISFSFTSPEALTSWKWMCFAHTKDLRNAYTEKTIITQKTLMVQPNAPRFFREGDRMEFTAKIVNLSDSEQTGTAVLELMNSTTNQPVDGWFKNIFPTQYFTVPAKQSVSVKFPIEIPFNYHAALSYRIVAKAGNYSDGEEMALPVLTNRMLVTETMPVYLNQQKQKEFHFDKLINSANSNTLAHHAITVEYSSNPVWYAVQSLPYLMEYPYECAEQTFNRYNANIMASYITRTMPAIQAVFEKWKNYDTAALLSNLQKNEELKSAFLQETPWVLDAKNESEQKKNIALLFDLVRMSTETNKAIQKLQELQTPSGGFSWFKGGRENEYITQYILTGIGHLIHLNAINLNEQPALQVIINKALPYLDNRIKKVYDEIQKNKKTIALNHLWNGEIQYLYMRSFFMQYPVAPAIQKAFNYFKHQEATYWLSESKYMQAMIALSLFRNNDPATAKAILRSLKENAITKEEMGMYWKEWNTGGYYWHQAPIESQALMIEAFTEIEKNDATVDALKTWLIKQKQVQNWGTTKASAEACYALLLTGSNWLNKNPVIEMQLGDQIIKTTDNPSEAGTGYIRKSFDADQVKATMGNISIKRTDTFTHVASSWGAVYWQYFEDLDKITPAQTPLTLTKQLFIEENTDHGPVLKTISPDHPIHIGDKIKVRIVLKADRAMEYVHMKDMRAACMEPVNTISEYKYQGGLGYYESTKDASTNFFFDQLPKGTFVFEYPLFVTHEGAFSNGITTIQCMYAPEFSSHSEGIRVQVESK